MTEMADFDDRNKTLHVIATIRTEFVEKFGVPRQSGLVEGLRGEIIFEPEYRNAEALKGIEEYSHLWLLWGFSHNQREGFVPTVHPPRLGGKIKKGVFATRAPFRPNAIGLSCVRLEDVIWESAQGAKLIVGGADLVSGTPIYDIKPYLPYTDAHPEASGGFGQAHSDCEIEVDFPQGLLERLPEEKRETAVGLLRQDPRAAYQKQQGAIYGMHFAGYDIRFAEKEGRLCVCDVVDAACGAEKVK
ncbi:MAG: tRNA (N6-threonylcarbamoyladenosine(37)-N6)-methyltransferase TrmO [Lachnospiraceae bacterium]|nr:tRNA (N6-threonylcarbamoyladenosine(37)-N6)-methyltransferase TrmO [Lachnospiraceae bacterium]